MNANIFKNKIILLLILSFIFIILSSVKGAYFKKQEKAEKENPALKEINKQESKKEEIVEVKIEGVSPTIEDPTFTPQPNTIIDSFVYPNASLIGKSSSSLVIESTDDPNIITDWYKDKIQSLNMNAVSTVKTNTNGNILNKMAASDVNLKVEIEISRSNSSEKAKIEVKLL